MAPRPLNQLITLFYAPLPSYPEKVNPDLSSLTCRYDFVEDDVTIRVSTDAHHSQRFDIWIKRKIDGLSVDAYVGDERDHLPPET